MKIQRVVFIIILFLFISSISFSDENEYEIWGVWNLGPKEHADIPFGNYLRTWDFLFFESTYFDYGPVIGYDGGLFLIKEIITRNENTISLYIQDNEALIDARREVVCAKVIVHFVDENNLWLELDYNDDMYPTSPLFYSTAYFQGSDIVFWRARTARNST